jgi:hypothetical protein
MTSDAIRKERLTALEKCRAAILRLRAAKADGRPTSLFRGNVCWHLSNFRYWNEIARDARRPHAEQMAA